MTTTPVRLGWGNLEDDLRSSMEGAVRFDRGARALYATDGSNYRQVPIGVVVPRSIDDVVHAIAVCRDHGAPVLSRGGGTSLAGQCCNTAVVIDWTEHLHHVLAIDEQRRTATVEPGCVLDDLNDAAKRHGLLFPPDPATHNHCTLGGMLGNNSCGTHSVMTGRTSDNVVRLEVLTYDGERLWVGPTSDDELESIIGAGGRRGEIYEGLRALRDQYAAEIRDRYPRIPRRVSGYNLDELLPENGFDVARALVGTEGTCVTILRAELALVPNPAARSLLVLGYPDVCAAADDAPAILEAEPIACEGVDHELFALTKHKHLHPDAVSLMPDGTAWLLVEFGGESKEESDEKAHRLIEQLRRDRSVQSMKLFDEPDDEHQIWSIRESGLGATARPPASEDTWEGWEDSAVPPHRLGDYLRDLRRLFGRYGYDGALYGHFGQGCVHTRINFDLRTAGGVATYRSFIEEAADLVVSYGGSLSGEHGDGQSRAELLPKMFGDDLVTAFARFKAVWDPGDHMNPGKVVRPYRIDENLRIGAAYEPAEPSTFFAFPDDEHRFSRAALRCVGVGECRKEHTGVMCPSYMVTRDEQHSTRGRTHLLFEMLRGEVITDGWRSAEVRDALDLCLACKGCKHECPVSVDMATYKAEFLAHHYARRLRPAAHYSMGWLPLAARAAAHAPHAVNTVTHAPILRRAAKRVAGIAPEREIPRFATTTFVSWFRSRGRSRPETGERPPVVLWPDTFTNHLHPHVAQAAVEVLEDAGYRVTVPDRPLCCGLTWISTGQLKTAKRVLQRAVRELREPVRSGAPVVGLEPSCTAVFRHDAHELFPEDEDVFRLGKATKTLAELLTERMDAGWQPPVLARRALVQPHCHHHAVLSTKADVALMQAMKLDAEVLDAGCCGLAGNFGFERGHYEVSMACAERKLFPAVRAADPDTLILADGFSCRTQLEQGLGRSSLHLAEALRMGA